MKKICFMVLVHEKRDIIVDMLNNIRHFCPNSSIVLYNGGDDPALCEGLGVPVCPTSHKLEYGFHATFFLEVMEWLTAIQFPYDYLINLDSDVLFARVGYEDFILQRMKNCEYMGTFIHMNDSRWGSIGYYPGTKMLEEWDTHWYPIFNQNCYYNTFCVGQVFSKKIVEKLLNHEKIERIKQTLSHSSAWGIEEILFITLIKQMDEVIQAYHLYPWDYFPRRSIRYRPHFTKEEVKDFLTEEDHYLFHPIYRNLQDEARVFIRNLMSTKTPQLEYCTVNSFYQDVNLLDTPAFVGRFQLTQYQTYLKINEPPVIPKGYSVYLHLHLHLPKSKVGNLEIRLVKDHWEGRELTYRNKPNGIPYATYTLENLKKGEISLNITKLMTKKPVPSFQLSAPHSDLIRLRTPVFLIMKEEKNK